jgi:hypothetical protein
MKIILQEQQLENLAFQFALDKLNNLDFRFKKYREFSFFPKGTHDADNGIEADWVKGEGYHILIGHSLFRSVRDLLGLDNEQTKDAFRKAFVAKGLKKIAEIESLDFSGYSFDDEEEDNELQEHIIKESKIDKLVFNYLDGAGWHTWDIGDGEFDVADGEHGKSVIKFTIQHSSKVPNHEFNVIYIDESLVTKINKLFGLNNLKSIKSIIEWVNKKYNKNLTMDDFEWMNNSDTYYDDEDDELYEHIIKEQYNRENVYPKNDVLKLLKGAPKELRDMIKTLPSIPCENDKGHKTTCTRIPETMWVYLTGRY